MTFLIPLSAISLGVMVLGERLEWNAVVGMGLIFMGVVLGLRGGIIGLLREKLRLPI